jgi:hypothetical protein
VEFEGEEGDEETAPPTNDTEFDVTKLGIFDESGKFYLKKGGHSRLFAYFKNFYVHRMQFVGG